MDTIVGEELYEAYRQAYTGCAVVERNTLGHIWAHGDDRLDLLHRLSTNDLLEMSEHEVKSTVLTNPLGRIVDYLIVLNLDNKSLLTTSPGKSEVVLQWIMKYVFFQDDVILQIPEQPLIQTDLYGPNAHDIATKIAPGCSTMSHNQACTISEGAWILQVPPPGGLGYEIIADPTITKKLVEIAISAGAVNAPSSLCDLLRVEAGLPGADYEIAASYIPLEIGLRDAISFTKGCYTGQEIIARMDSRGKLAKTLVGLRSSEELSIGAVLRAPDGSRGTVTSSVYSPKLGWIGLGLVKPAVCSPGTELSVLINGLSGSASVSKLPFDVELPV